MRIQSKSQKSSQSHSWMTEEDPEVGSENKPASCWIHGSPLVAELSPGLHGSDVAVTPVVQQLLPLELCSRKINETLGNSPQSAGATRYKADCSEMPPGKCLLQGPAALTLS